LEEQEPVDLTDLGDAMVETKQQHPLGPFIDSAFGFGRRPNT